MYRLNFISIFLIVLISVLSAAEFPSDVKRCKSADSECQKKVLQEIVEKFHSKGHPGLNLDPFDPYKLKKLAVPRVSKTFVFNVEVEFNEVTLTGVSNVKVEKVSGLKEDGPNKFTYELEGNFPQIVLTGPYSVDGSVIFVSISGDGKSKITFDDIHAKIKGKCSIVEKVGKKYLNVDEVEVDFNPKGANFDFDNIGSVANGLMNHQWDSIYNEVKPVIMKDLSKILINILNDVFSKFEYSEVFLPE